MSTDQLTLMRQAFRLANDSAISILRSEGVQVVIAGWVFLDTRPMLDPREHSGENIDLAQCVIDYALGAGLAMRHPQRPELLRIHQR